MTERQFQGESQRRGLSRLMTENKMKSYRRKNKILVDNLLKSKFMALLLKFKDRNAGIYQVSIEFWGNHADPQLRNVTTWDGKNWTRLGSKSPQTKALMVLDRGSSSPPATPRVVPPSRYTVVISTCPPLAVEMMVTSEKPPAPRLFTTET